MVVKTEEEGTWRAFFEKNITLTPEKQKYSFEYTMPADSNKALGLKFLLGSTSNALAEAHSVIIDNVVCEVQVSQKGIKLEKGKNYQVIKSLILQIQKINIPLNLQCLMKQI